MKADWEQVVKIQAPLSFTHSSKHPIACIPTNPGIMPSPCAFPMSLLPRMLFQSDLLFMHSFLDVFSWESQRIEATRMDISNHSPPPYFNFLALITPFGCLAHVLAQHRLGKAEVNPPSLTAYLRDWKDFSVLEHVRSALLSSPFTRKKQGYASHPKAHLDVCGRRHNSDRGDRPPW